MQPYRLALLLCVAASVGMGSGHALADGAPGTPYVPGEVLVGMRPSRFAADARSVGARVGTVEGYQSSLRAVRVRLRAGQSLDNALRALRSQPDVLFAEPNYILNISRQPRGGKRDPIPAPNDPSFATQYAPRKIQADVAWGSWKPITPTVLAIVDTGVDADHPDLHDKMLRDANGKVVGYNAITANGSTLDDNAHGTHCAGIAAAQINNGLGVAGIAGWNGAADASDTSFVKIMPVKVMDKNGTGKLSAVIDGIVWASDHGAKVISLSLGSSATSVALDTAVQHAWAKGCVVVAAAGNDGVKTRFYPAACDNVISVAATDSNDKLTSFSNYGDWVKTAAPGLSILSTLPGGKYGTMSGTSMATPHVAGEAALILAQCPYLSNAEVGALIAAQVDPYLPYATRKIGSGAGRINVALALLEAVRSGQDPIHALTLDAPTAKGGATLSGMVTLSAPAPAGGVNITLASADETVASLPQKSVLIAEGQITGTFPIETGIIATTTSVQITATRGDFSKSATLKVSGLKVSKLQLSAATAQGEQSLTGSVTLENTVPDGQAVTVKLSSSNSVVTVPATVTVGGGASSATFPIQAHRTGSNTDVTLSAVTESGLVTARLSLRAQPAVLTAFGFSQQELKTGQSAYGILNTDVPVANSGAVVTLSSDNPAIAVPGTVKIKGGQQGATFQVTAGAVTKPTTVTVSATLNGVTKTAQIRLGETQARLTRVDVTPSELRGGANGVGMVYISDLAPRGGIVVSLTSSDPNVKVPAKVTIFEGYRFMTFPIITKAVDKPTKVTITASCGEITQKGNLTVIPANK